VLLSSGTWNWTSSSWPSVIVSAVWNFAAACVTTCGLLAPVARKNSWQLAEQAGHSTPDGLQHLLAGAKWEPDDIRDDLQEYVADTLGEDDGVLIIDDTGFVTKGTTSAGVQRQYSGTAGRTENCQIGVFAAYASTRGRALVDRELYLPKSWAGDRERCRAAKVPDEREFSTKGELARRMVLRALASPLPVAWVTADSAYGQESRFRRLLEQSGVGYVLAVPKSQFTVGCPRIEGLFAQAPDEAWEKISCGDGAKGPRVYHWAVVRLPAVAEFEYQGEVPCRMRWALARRSVRKPDEIALLPRLRPFGDHRPGAGADRRIALGDRGVLVRHEALCRIPGSAGSEEPRCFRTEI
jgi:hypothetical protein